MRWAFTVAFCLAAASAAPAATAPKKARTVSSTAAKSSAHKTVATKGKYSTSRNRRTRSARAHTPPPPSYQLHPDPERYQQIQQALADRGYFKGQVNGQWSDDSVDALKRFQADQKMTDDGKINSLSLIGLGLGPKHDGTTASSVPAPAPALVTDPQPPKDPGVSSQLHP